jgi:hypothetical protein
MQSGELIVTGAGEAIIQLRNFPGEVKVKFINDLELVPCNPQHVDTLEYEVQTTATGVVLVVTWNVTGVREVKWHVAY